MNMEDLENQLASSSARVKMIVSDGVFSMDGDIAPLKYANMYKKHLQK